MSISKFTKSNFNLNDKVQYKVTIINFNYNTFMEISEYIDTIINNIINQFDFGFMFTINVFTYILIQVWDNLNDEKLLTTWQKRLMLLLSILIVTVVYKLAHYPNDIILFNSIIFAPVFWSWILRPILVKLGLGYKQFND